MLKPQLLIFVRNISYENKRKAGKQYWKEEVFLLGCWQEQRSRWQPRGAPSEAGQAPQHLPEMQTKVSLQRVLLQRGVGLGKCIMCHYVQFPFEVSFLNNYSYYVGGQSLNIDKDLCSCSIIGLVFNMHSIISLEGKTHGCSQPLFSQIIFNLSWAQLGRADKHFCT